MATGLPISRPLTYLMNLSNNFNGQASFPYLYEFEDDRFQSFRSIQRIDRPMVLIKRIRKLSSSSANRQVCWRLGSYAMKGRSKRIGKSALWETGRINLEGNGRMSWPLRGRRYDCSDTVRRMVKLDNNRQSETHKWTLMMLGLHLSQSRDPVRVKLELSRLTTDSPYLSASPFKCLHYIPSKQKA